MFLFVDGFDKLKAEGKENASEKLGPEGNVGNGIGNPGGWKAWIGDGLAPKMGLIISAPMP